MYFPAAGVPESELGLRERKRLATERTIERAALDLAQEHGYEGVTVEMICESAMVSPRTFFNYFGSKEGVFLGHTPPRPTPEMIDWFVNERPSTTLLDLVELFRRMMSTRNRTDPAAMRERRALIHSTPDLAVREFARMAEAETELTALLQQRRDAVGTEGSDVFPDEPRVVVLLAFAIMHPAMHRWLEDPDGAPQEELIADSLQMIRRIIDEPTHS
ncbi:AcrR family transcriptional regulator [Mycetocola sp. BIGb0189]|uniref:TetR/AcrR family transcriptional regulator n=1 Tax=Mycetocola sp. BIGb0189 TaxID=2940604 RepID=UPI0021680950|nr:TetR/AcrR family transcriptional regulator [Mycetocola sp. BIGb0189]MCS4277354.1 AcrR family transcriptional regulator [Mycetocola sp. BIGb0189]